VETYLNGNKYFGKIVWLRKPKNAKGIFLKDGNNPDPKKRKNRLLGLVVLFELEYRNGKWENGTLYNPGNGESYTCKLWLKNPNTLIGRGFWGMIYKTQEWTRVK
jgi:uncharacterized protein (DUF2147 family)